MKPRIHHALAGTGASANIDTAAANDKPIRFVFIGKIISLTLSFPTLRQFISSLTAMSTEAGT